jgi:hypothetical protein
MQQLDYDANKYLIVTLSQSDPSSLKNVHPAVTDIGQVGQLRNVHRIAIPKRDWDEQQHHILEALRQIGVSRIDHDELRQRVKRIIDDF